MNTATKLLSGTEIRTGAYFKMVGEHEIEKFGFKSIFVKRCEIYKRGSEVYAILYYNDGDEYTKRLDPETEYSGWCVEGQAAAEQLNIANGIG